MRPRYAVSAKAAMPKERPRREGESSGRSSARRGEGFDGPAHRRVEPGAAAVEGSAG